MVAAGGWVVSGGEETDGMRRAEQRRRSVEESSGDWRESIGEREKINNEPGEWCSATECSRTRRLKEGGVEQRVEVSTAKKADVGG